MKKPITSGILDNTILNKETVKAANAHNNQLLYVTSQVSEALEEPHTPFTYTPRSIAKLAERVAKAEVFTDDLAAELVNTQGEILYEAAQRMQAGFDHLNAGNNSQVVSGLEALGLLLYVTTSTMKGIDRDSLYSSMAEECSLKSSDAAYKALVLGYLETLYQLLLTDYKMPIVRSVAKESLLIN